MTICTSKDFPPCQHEDLIALVERLQEQVAGLKAANEELQRQLAESQRGGKRQAAPFSKGKRGSKPRRPGRKPDMGLFGYRKPPSPDEVTEPVVEVAVSVEVCPGCGGRLEDEGMGVAYVTDISSDSASAGDGVPGADMSVPVLRQAGPRPASRYWVGPVRRQRPPGWETSDRGGSRAPLRGGRSGKKGSRCAQSADRGGSESGSDQPGRAATCHGCGGVSLPQAADLGGRESTRPHR